MLYRGVNICDLLECMAMYVSANSRHVYIVTTLVRFREASCVGLEYPALLP